jgi:hypothetical protein
METKKIFNTKPVRGQPIPEGAPFGDIWHKGEPLEKELFPHEIQALHELKEICPESKHYTDRFLMMCLFARKMNLKRAKHLVERNWKWRVSVNLQELPSYEEQTDYPGWWSSGFEVPAVRSKEGHVVVFLRPAMVDPKKITIDDLNKFMAYFYIHIIQFERMDAFRNGYMVVQDFTGYSWKHFDMGLQKAMGAIFQDNFPITRRKCLVINPPTIFKALLAVFKLFIKKKLMDRIKVIKPEELQDYIDLDDIPIMYGGKLDWDGKKSHEFVYRWDCEYKGIEIKKKDVDALFSAEHTDLTKVDHNYNPEDFKVVCTYCEQSLQSTELEEHMIQCMKAHPRSINELD